MELSMPKSQTGRLFLIRSIAEYIEHKCGKVRSAISTVDNDSTHEELRNAEAFIADIMAAAQDMRDMMETESATLPPAQKEKDDDINGGK